MENSQLNLWPECNDERPLTPREKYLRWRNQNDELMDIFDAYVQKMIAHHKKFAFYALAEYIRWNEYFETHSSDETDQSQKYKISNDHIPYIAREFLGKYPCLSNFVVYKRTHNETDKIIPIYR